jgi:hypothetical protein
LVNTNNFVEPSSSLPSLSPSSPLSPSSSSSSSLLEEKFINLKTPLKPTPNLTKSVKSKSKSHNSSSIEESLLNPIGLSQTKSNGVLSKKEISNLLSSESFPNVNIEPPSTVSSNLPTNSKSINVGSFTQSLTRSNNNEPPNPFNKVIPEEIISNSNNNRSITLKTLGVTLKVDQPNKNKLQPNSSQFNGLSTDITENKLASGADADVDVDANDTASTTAVETQLFNMNNDLPVLAVEGSSANTSNYITGNGLLNANTTSEVDGANALTVEEYSKMLFGQSDIDINFDLDNILPNFNTMDVNMQGNDANIENIENMDNMDLDEFLGAFDSLDSSKISGNEMNVDFDSFIASLGGGFTETEIPNGMSGNNLNVESNTALVNTNGMNGIQNNTVNGHLDIYAEMVNGNSNGASENNSTLEDLTFGSVNGQDGYHENIEKTKDGVNGLVEDEGKNVVGKTINGDSVSLIEEKEVDQKKDCES